MPDKKDDKKNFEGPEHLKRIKFNPEALKKFQENWDKRMSKPTNPNPKKKK